MTITVDHISSDDGSDVYTDASAEVEDSSGILTVRNSRGMTVAVYAPQAWLRLRVS